MHVKRFVVAITLIAILITIGPIARALTFSDIDLLVSLGLIDEYQAHIARDAIMSGMFSGASGTSIRTDEFAAQSCLVFNQDLVRGMSGTAVGALQTFLRQQGFYKDAEITQYYGPITAEAVIDFQLEQRLVFTRISMGAGNVGPLTRERIRQVSCDAALAPPAPEPAPAPAPAPTVITPTLPPVLPQVIAPPVQRTQYTVSIFSRLIDSDERRGEWRYQFDFDIEPKEHRTHTWRISLACDEEFVATNRKDLGCGDSISVFSSTKESKSIKINLTNTDEYRYIQPFRITAVAIDSSERVLGQASLDDDLSPKELLNIQDQTNFGQPIDGFTSLPTTVPCNEIEQLRFLRYIMTPPDSPMGQVVLPPSCYPGPVSCSNDYPISYCFIRGTNITSNDLCPREGEFFYNGACQRGVVQ